MGLRVVSFKLPQRMFSQIRKRAARRGVSPSDMARLLLLNGLESDPRKLTRIIKSLLSAHHAVYRGLRAITVLVWPAMAVLFDKTCQTWYL